MPIKLIVDGIEEMVAELAALPNNLGDESTPIIVEHVTTAEREITSRYPRRAGELADMMSSQITVKQGHTHGVVINASEHAKPFEFGTQARHTALGADRGAMPPGHVFLPIYNRENRASLMELSALVERHGLRVTDDGT